MEPRTLPQCSYVATSGNVSLHFLEEIRMDTPCIVLLISPRLNRLETSKVVASIGRINSNFGTFYVWFSHGQSHSYIYS